MGNENSRPASFDDGNLLDELCSLTSLEYSRTYRLSCDPFCPHPPADIPSSSHDFPISAMTDEAEETQPLRPPSEGQGSDPSSWQGQPVDAQALQKNQNQSKPAKKIKKISKDSKPKRIGRTGKETPAREVQDGEGNQNETVEEGIRDQNNCKSYHKLVKNFLIEKGLGGMIEKYDSKYHTRYYFIVSLLMVKHHLDVGDFPALYQAIVEAELATQQRKIDRKSAELRAVREKLQAVSGGQGVLRVKEGSLQSQIEHIKVVKFEIGDYSLRSCRAFFQGSMEEALRILYLKNDPVMRKKYYFEEALEMVKDIQLEMRKNRSHR